MRLLRDTGSNRTYVIDKHPLNFWHLGFITLLFPNARIIHCKRHPLDVGLSNYFQRFKLVYNYSFDLSNIGHYYRGYASLMEHWRDVLPVEMIEVTYEDMVLNSEQAVRRILGCLDLEWDERCIAPHTNPCAIETASHWQARQPIFAHSLDRWRNHEAHLAPLKQALHYADQDGLAAV